MSDDIVDDTAPAGRAVEPGQWAYTPRGPGLVERVDGPRGPWVVRALDGRRYRVSEAIPCLPSGDPWAPRRDALGPGAVVTCLMEPGWGEVRVVSADRAELATDWGRVLCVSVQVGEGQALVPLSALRLVSPVAWWPPDWGAPPDPDATP